MFFSSITTAAGCQQHGAGGARTRKAPPAFVMVVAMGCGSCCGDPFLPRHCRFFFLRFEWPDAHDDSFYGYADFDMKPASRTVGGFWKPLFPKLKRVSPLQAVQRFNFLHKTMRDGFDWNHAYVLSYLCQRCDVRSRPKQQLFP